MKTLILNKEEFNIEKFMDKYEKDLKNIFSSLEEEDIFDLIDFFNVENMNICKRPDKTSLNLILENKEIGAFLLIGGVADEHVNFFRFLNGIQYRINTGEVYEHSAERFHDFEIIEKMIDTGYINFNVETSLGLGIYIKNDSIVINLYEICPDGETVRVIKESGELGRIIIKYIEEITQ